LRTLKSNSAWDLVSGSNYHVPIDLGASPGIVMQSRSDPQLSAMLRALFYRTKFCLLDGIGRLNLTMARAVGPLTGPPQNHLQALFVDDARRTKLKQA